MEINDLLDQAKKRANLKSDYALAKVLGISNGYISEYRKGKRHPGNEEAVKLATLAGLDEMQVIAAIELLTANTEKKKEFWKHYIESRGITASFVMAGLAISILTAPKPAEASILQLQNYGEAEAGFFESRNIHCAKYKTPKKLIIKALFLKLKQLLISYPAPHGCTI